MKYFVVHTFTDTIFEGNPAGVCIMDEWLTDELMQKIALENRLSETAFTVKEGNAYRLRWFTPGSEIDLCGHATLGTAFVLLNYYEPDKTSINFNTVSGLLTVTRRGKLYELDFPTYKLTKVDVTDEMEEAIGTRPIEAWLGRDLNCVLESEESVYSAKPNLDKVIKLDGQLLNITAHSKKYDCVSRSFAPKVAVDEDPVCGSAHCQIVPLWSEKLKKNNIIARQASKRGGTLYCEYMGSRIKISGGAVLYSKGELYVESYFSK